MEIRAHAKINRSLSVLGVRPDGYHELRTVFQSLALYDTLVFAPASEGLVIDCDAVGVPRDQSNLVWKAARLVWQEAGRRGEPAGRIRLVKRIPAQGGLGGGSADGAAAIVGWSRLWDVPLSAEQTRGLAARLGADVPFFLAGGTALGVARGDEIHVLDDPPPRWVVLVFPPFGISTPEAFRWWDEDHRAESTGPGIGGLRPEVRPGVVNDLEAAVARRHPELLEIRGHLERAGAEQAAMTGSGSTMFGLFADRASADLGAGTLRGRGWSVLVTRTATRQEAAFGVTV